LPLKPISNLFNNGVSTSLEKLIPLLQANTSGF